MSFHSPWRFLLAPIIGLALQAPLMGIVINDTNTSGYITGSNYYTGVVEILFNQIAQSGTYLCSGALISPVQILTAGHCISGADNWNVTFQTPSGTYVVGVTQTALDPLFGPMPPPDANLDYYDVGLLTLSAPAPSDAEIYKLHLTLSDVYTTSIVDMVGYGLGGNPAVGYLDTGTRRHAQNTNLFVVGGFEDGTPTPDNPLAMWLTFVHAGGGGTGLPNGGDSGGPLLFNDQILGVTSFGDLPRPGSGSYAYGVQYYGAFADIGNPVIGNWVESELVPEPGTWALMGLGTLALFVFRRVRRYGLANVGAELDGRGELGS